MTLGRVDTGTEFDLATKVDFVSVNAITEMKLNPTRPESPLLCGSNGFQTI